MNIASRADAHLQATGDFTAFVFEDRAYGSAWCHDAVCRLAQAFASLGISPGDRVVVVLPNGIEHVLARFAALRAGAVVVCVAPTAAAAEIERIVDHAEACALVTGADLVGSAASAAARVRCRIVAGQADGWTNIDGLIASHPPMIDAVPRAAHDLAQISYTSGVSSVPKGVVITHGTLQGRAELVRLQNAGASGRGTVRLAVLPFSYSWGSSTLLATLQEKTTLVGCAAFEPGAILSTVARHRVERMALVPPMCESLVAWGGAGAFDLSSLRAIEVGGAPVTDDLLDRCESALGVRPVVLYGMTEHGLLTMPSPARKPRACGRLRPGVSARIVDAEGRDVPPGEAGELLVSSPGTAAGYYKDPVATERTFRDGWLHTGDLARLDGDRDLSIVGRVKDLIIQGGVNVTPADVAQVIRQIGGVRECAVVGVPSAFLGEEVTACVVLDADARVTEDDVLAHCRRNMDLRKSPTSVRFLPELPHTSAGKIRTADLAAQIAAERAVVVRTALVRELETMDGARRGQRLRAEILSCVGAVLAGRRPRPLDTAAAGRTFGEMGVDSIGAVVLANGLSHRLGRPLPATLTFNHVTVEALAAHLQAELFGDPVRGPAPAFVPARAGGPPIAVVGIGCRLPGGADSAARFWELLKDGIDASGDVPRSRFDVEPFFDPVRGALGKTYVRRGAFVEADAFDAGFFGLGPREAEELAPEHRLLLEVAWEALEDAGYGPSSLAESMTSLFLGMTASHYGEGRPPSGDLTAAVAAGRVSHFLNLRGPSVAVDTACSSSLVALHEAVQSLRRGESDAAIAAGVKVISSATWLVNACQRQIASADGRTRAFDADAGGTSLGEGCVAVVLKRLEDASAAGDRVLAIVRGSAINSDGRSTSLAAPNGKAQEAVIRAALRDAGVAPRDVDYLEAHGTGTILGDPIELQAALAAYSEERSPERPLVVGSVKTNIGHLEAAAGLAGFVKAVLALRERTIPASLNFRRLNPVLTSQAARLAIPTEARPWPAVGDRHRLAAVTSMGISGTNAHVVVEEAPAAAPVPAPDAPALLVLSARTADGLDRQIARYARHLADRPELAAADVCATAALGRTHFDERLAVAAASRGELQAALDGLARGEMPIGCARGRAIVEGRPRLVFLFPGQGSQYAGMGRTLYEREPAFRDALDRCAAALEPLLGRSLASIVFPQDGGGALLDETAYAQPALLAIAVSLAELWRSWGVVPDAVVGQSQGEIAAACVAGALSLEDAAKVVCRRSRLLRRLRGLGGMAVVGLPEAQTLERLAGRERRIGIAVTNGSASTVVSGDVDAIQELVAELDSHGVFCRRLNVDYSSHSHHVDEIRADLLAALSDVVPRDAAVPFYSTVTCGRLSGRELDAGYWAQNLREPVRFARLMNAMVAEGFGSFVEVSPHPSLGMTMSEWVGAIPGGAWVPSLRRERDDRAAMRASLGELYVRGLEVDWTRLHPEGAWRRTPLPTYPFERRRYWRPTLLGSLAADAAPVAEADATEAAPARHAFRDRLSAAAPDERGGLLVGHLRGLLSGLLGDAAATIAVDRNLLGCGLDSLRIMSFLAAVQRTLECVCLPADFVSRPTLRDFAAYLEERVAPAPSAAAPETSSPLVVVRTEGAAAPIFCFHPAGGQVTAYLRLGALLGDDRPVYALQSRACREPEREHESVAAMAADYADVVEGARPGPYVLLGWSMGGVVGHAVAAELERRGRSVRLVAMIDPPAPGELALDDVAAAVRAAVVELRPEQASNEDVFRRFRGQVLPPNGNAAALLADCEKEGFLPRGAVPPEIFDAMVRLRLRHVELVRAHRPGAIRADTAVFRAGEPRAASGWSAHTHGRTTERFLGGSHYTIVLPPRIEAIARELLTLCAAPALAGEAATAPGAARS